MPRLAFIPASVQRWSALASLATGVFCPCHALVGAVAALTGNAVLSPAAQDGLHAIYVPLAVVTGALLLRRGPRH